MVIPTGIEESGWFEVDETCRQKLGLEFDKWQDGAGRLLLAKRADGHLAHTVGGFGMSICRQTGKTHFVSGSVFGLSVNHTDLLTIWSAHHSKALDCATELLTANRGWVTMADIRVGDQVFHPSGQPTIVSHVSPVMLGNSCFEVATTDGRSLIADAEHLWTVTDKNQKYSSGSGSARKRWLKSPVTITTQDMFSASLNTSGVVRTRGVKYRTGKYRFMLPAQAALEDIPDRDLPIDPYLLGAWLGDGDSVAATLTSGDQDLQHWVETIQNVGYLPKPRKYGNRAWNIGITSEAGVGQHARSLRGKLRSIGALGNKHVPDIYLISSTAQRIALLQGLLDTDGSINHEGTVYFTSTLRNLSESVLFLARSLGWRATMNEGKSNLNGKECKTVWRITFTPNRSDRFVPFRLTRKIERIRGITSNHGRFSMSISSIEPVATRPVRCIKVAAPDGLYLAGRDLIPTHNTHMETFMAMQAFASRSRIAPFIDKVYTGSGDEEIRFRSGSRILFGARERGFGRGIPGVDILVSDEGQILSQRAMQNMLATMNTSQLGLHIYAGTPPKPEDNSEVWLQMRDEALSGESTDLVWIEMGADDDADLDDQDQWRKANPSIPHRTPIHAIMRLRKRLDDDGFRREALGVYDDNEGSVFDLLRWNRLSDTSVAAPDQVALMVDVSPDRKWSSIGVAGEVDGDRTIVMTESIKGTAGVVPRLKELLGITEDDDDDESRDVLEVAIFGGGAARVLEPDLVKAGIEYEKLTASDMAAAYGNLQEMIKSGAVVHVEQPELNIALANTKTRYLQTGEAEAFDRRGQHIDISPAVAAAGALYRFGLLQNPMPVIL